MKKILSFVLCLIIMLGCCAFADDAPANEGLQQDIVIIYTSDVHCGIDQGWTYTGLYGIKQHLAKDNYILLVDNGDSVQGESIGAISKGEVDIKLMNALEYDASAIGNHEFDYGIDRFFELTELAEFPYLSCNFTREGELLFAPYIIKEFDGVKIALIGISTPDTFQVSTPTYFQDENGNYIYSFCEGNNGENLYAAVQKAVDDARAEGAQYVIAMAHLGISTESSPYMSSDVITHTNGIDVLLDGHSHSILEQEEVKNKDGNIVLQSACGTKLQAIGWCKITTDGKISTGLYKWSPNESAVDLLGLTNDFSPIMAAETDTVNEMLNEVVAHTNVDLIISDPASDTRVIRKLETNLGDLVADAYRDATGADVALVNGGGIRANIPAGDITLGQIKSCHPFGNSLCMVEATGQQIVDALEWTSSAVPDENGSFLQVSGLTYEINAYLENPCTQDDYGAFTGVSGERRVRNVMVNGEPIDLEKTYTVASHNYILKSGGGGTNMFMTDPIILDEIKFDYETVIDYIVETLGGTVGMEYSNIWGDGRINIIYDAP